MERYSKFFIDIKLSPKTVYIYSVRKALQKAIDDSIKMFQGVLLDLGCGEMPYREYILDRNEKITKYIGMDINYNQYHQITKPDMIWNGKKITLEDEKVDTVIATELLEHLSNAETVLGEINRVLSREGILFFTVPFVWPLHETPYDEYRYTPYSLKRILKKAGFREITIIPLGGYNASLAQMLGIWIQNNRGERSSLLRRKFLEIFEKYILYKIMERLLKKDDRLSTCGYAEGTMASGFYGYAKK